MKITKLIVLLASVSILAACGKSTSKSNAVSSNNVVSSSEVATESSQEPSSASSSETVVSSSSTAQVSSSTQTSSSTQASSSTNATTSSSVAVQGNELSVSFFNPTCGSMSKEILSEGLTTYINSLVETPIVSKTTSNDSQITNDIPTAGDKVLQLGASSKTGTIEFTFTQAIKSVTIKAQTYHKPYVQTWVIPNVTVPNVDSNSALQITTTGDAPVFSLDLRPGEGEEPLEKDITIETNSNILRLHSVNEDNGRVFIKSLTLVY